MDKVDELLEVSERTKKELIEKILKWAFSFECCPNCGNINAESHYCDICKERIVELDDAYWFSQFLIKEFDLNFPCFMKG